MREKETLLPVQDECCGRALRSRRVKYVDVAVPVQGVGASHQYDAGPAACRGARKNRNGEGFLKPSRNNEALTTPSGFPRTGGMPSV